MSEHGTVTVDKHYFDLLRAEREDLKRAADNTLASAALNGGYRYGVYKHDFYAINVDLLNQLYRARNIVGEHDENNSGE